MRTTHFIVITLCQLALLRSAQAETIRRIGLDGTKGLPAPASKRGKDGIERIHKIQQAALELFPCAKKPSRGTVLVNPGGGYGILAINHEGRPVARFLNECGYDAAVLLYHVSEGPKTRDMAIKDAKNALGLLRKRGPEFGLNARRIGAMGFSAGGHLAARLAHETASGDHPDFLVLIYPAYLEKGGILHKDVIPPSVPIFLYVAADDKWSPSSRAFDAYCRKHKLPCEFHEARKGGHGFGLKKTLPEGVKDWPDKLKAFLERVKRPTLTK